MVKSWKNGTNKCVFSNVNKKVKIVNTRVTIEFYEITHSKVLEKH